MSSEIHSLKVSGWKKLAKNRTLKFFAFEGSCLVERSSLGWKKSNTALVFFRSSQGCLPKLRILSFSGILLFRCFRKHYYKRFWYCWTKHAPPILRPLLIWKKQLNLTLCGVSTTLQGGAAPMDPRSCRRGQKSTFRNWRRRFCSIVPKFFTIVGSVAQR